MGKAERTETTVGVVAVLVGLAVMAIAATANRLRGEADASALSYTADFARIDGIKVGAPVRLAGVNVGTVTGLSLDQRFRAVATLTFDREVPLPDDSAAVIETDGIFGSKYVEVQPGGSEVALKRGGMIGFTQDSVIIEDLVSRIVQQAKATQKAAQEAAKEKAP